MNKLFLLLSVSLIFSCGPSQETKDAAKIMCDCSEDISFEDWGTPDNPTWNGITSVSSLYSCLGESGEFLSYLELDTSANILTIEERLSEKFDSDDMDKAIEKQCPKLHEKMKSVGLIYEK
jgi:hypothetical protein